MVWKLELVHSDDCLPIERITVCELDEIVASAALDDVGLDLRTSHRIVCDLQRTVVALQEGALKDNAV